MPEGRFTPPPGIGDVGAKVYRECRTKWVSDHPNDVENAANKTMCAKIAWTAQNNASKAEVANVPMSGNITDCMKYFADKYPDESTRRTYCAKLQNASKMKSEQGHVVEDLPEDAREMWVVKFTEALEDHDEQGASRIAWACIYRHYEKTPNGGWKPFKAFENIAFKTIIKQDRIIYGAASVAIVDSDNEMITADALKTAFNSYIDRGHVLFYHKNIPVGEVLPKYEASSGEIFNSGVREGKLDVVVRIYKDTQIANEVWKEIEDGNLRAFSIGGQVVGDPVKVCPTEDTCYNRIDKIDLHEISIVPNPANEASYFRVIKGMRVADETTKPEAREPEKPVSVETRRLELLKGLISDEWSKARNCPNFTEKALKILNGEMDMGKEQPNLAEIAATLGKVASELAKYNGYPNYTEGQVSSGLDTPDVTGKPAVDQPCPQGYFLSAEGKCEPQTTQGSRVGNTGGKAAKPASSSSEDGGMHIHLHPPSASSSDDAATKAKPIAKPAPASSSSSDDDATKAAPPASSSDDDGTAAPTKRKEQMATKENEQASKIEALEKQVAELMALVKKSAEPAKAPEPETKAAAPEVASAPKSVAVPETSVGNALTIDSYDWVHPQDTPKGEYLHDSMLKPFQAFGKTEPFEALRDFSMNKAFRGD